MPRLFIKIGWIDLQQIWGIHKHIIDAPKFCFRYLIMLLRFETRGLTCQRLHILTLANKKLIRR